MTWLDDAIAAVKGLEPAVLVTVIAAEGSSPREAGAKMLVKEKGFAGTIGGGGLELRVMETARTLLAGDLSFQFEDIQLGPDLGQCCGGFVHLLYERLTRADIGWLRAWERASQGLATGVLTTRFDPHEKVWQEAEVDAPVTIYDDASAVLTERVRRVRLPVWIFGAGHVGLAMAPVLASLDFDVTVVDERQEWLDKLDDSQVTPLFSLVPEGEVARMPTGALLFAMTPTHALDFDICAAGLAREDIPLVGMIGSRSKRVQALRYFASQNISEAALERFVSPIGIPGLKDKRPAAIAVSVGAQLLQYSRERQALPQEVTHDEA